VRQQFESGALWPAPILQANPAHEAGPTLKHPPRATALSEGSGSPLSKPRRDARRCQWARRSESSFQFATAIRCSVFSAAKSQRNSACFFKNASRGLRGCESWRLRSGFPQLGASYELG
jgi:hypothetical protein